jgi:hypothetical protein
MFGRRPDIASAAIRDPRAIAIEDAATSEYWKARCSDWHPRRRFVDVLPPLGRLVRFSRKVWLIDYCMIKHFEGGRIEKIAPTVKELLRQWAAAAVPRAEFKLVTENPENHSCETLRRWVEPLRYEVQQYLPADHAPVAVVFYNAPHREFHRNRFLLTDVACVQVGKGFDLPARPSGGREVLTLLSHDTSKTVESDFDLWRAPIEVSLR